MSPKTDSSPSPHSPSLWKGRSYKIDTSVYLHPKKPNVKQCMQEYPSDGEVGPGRADEAKQGRTRQVKVDAGKCRQRSQ